MTEKKPPRKAAPTKAAPAKSVPRRGRMTPEKDAPAKRAPRKASPGKTAVDEAPDNVFTLPVRPGSGRSAGEGRRGGRGPSTGSKSSPKAATVALRRADALALRRNGASWIQIAESLSTKYSLPKYDNRAAWQDVRDAIEHVKVENVMEYVEEQKARLDGWLLRIADRIASGDLDALDRALKIEKRRADLLGMDAARRIQLTGPDGGPIQFEATVYEDDEATYQAAMQALDDTLGPPRELPG